MTEKEIDNKLQGLHKKGIELANEIEKKKNALKINEKEYSENFKHINTLLEIKETIIKAKKKLAKFEPQG